MENKKAPLRGAFLVRVTGLDYLGCASYGVAAVKPSASNTPPGCCIWIGSSPYLITKQKGEAKASPFYLVRIVGLEPTRRWHRNLNPTRLPIPSYPHIIKLFSLSPCCGTRCAPCRRCACVAFAARLGCPISSLPTMRLRQLSTPAHTYAPLYLPLAARSNVAAATRSGRFIRHRRRSHRSPSPAR